MRTQLPVLMAVLIGLIAAGWDLRTRRVPNKLTLSAPIVALLWFSFASGLDGLWFSVSGWLVGLAVFLPFYLLGGMGAGDVKLVAALGSWLGPVVVFWSALYAGISGGVLAIVVALFHGYLRTAFRNLGFVLFYWRTVGPRPVPSLTLADARGPRLAYALPILIGMVAALWLR